MTLIVIDFIYSKFSELCPTPCLGIASTPPAFTKIPPPPPFPGYQKLSTKKIPTPPTLLPHDYSIPLSIRHLRVHIYMYAY